MHTRPETDKTDCEREKKDNPCSVIVQSQAAWRSVVRMSHAAMSFMTPGWTVNIISHILRYYSIFLMLITGLKFAKADSTREPNANGLITYDIQLQLQFGLNHRSVHVWYDNEIPRSRRWRLLLFWAWGSCYIKMRESAITSQQQSQARDGLLSKAS